MSIITPTLNRLTYLRECVDSVLNQDYADLEHVIMDGGSSDGTVQFLEGLSSQYGNRIRWVSKPDKGISEAVNRGLELATGNVIGWIGSDDKLAPEALRTVAGYFTNHPDALWLYGSYVEIEGNGAVLRLKRAEEFDRRRFVRSGYICGPSVFVRTELARRVGPVREDLSYAMDFEWCLRIASIAPPHRLDTVLAYFRWHPGCITMARRSAQLDEGLALSLTYAQDRWERAQTLMFYKAVKILAWLRRLPWRLQLRGSGS